MTLYRQRYSEFKHFKENLNINVQITIDVRSLPWHSGKVLESTVGKSASLSSKITIEVGK